MKVKGREVLGKKGKVGTDRQSLWVSKQRVIKKNLERRLPARSNPLLLWGWAGLQNDRKKGRGKSGKIRKKDGKKEKGLNIKRKSLLLSSSRRHPLETKGVKKEIKGRGG